MSGTNQREAICLSGSESGDDESQAVKRQKVDALEGVIFDRPLAASLLDAAGGNPDSAAELFFAGDFPQPGYSKGYPVVLSEGVDGTAAGGPLPSKHISRFGANSANSAAGPAEPDGSGKDVMRQLVYGDPPSPLPQQPDPAAPAAALPPPPALTLGGGPLLGPAPLVLGGGSPQDPPPAAPDSALELPRPAYLLGTQPQYGARTFWMEKEAVKNMGGAWGEALHDMPDTPQEVKDSPVQWFVPAGWPADRDGFWYNVSTHAHLLTPDDQQGGFADWVNRGRPQGNRYPTAAALEQAFAQFDPYPAP